MGDKEEKRVDIAAGQDLCKVTLTHTPLRKQVSSVGSGEKEVCPTQKALFHWPSECLRHTVQPASFFFPWVPARFQILFGTKSF